MLQLKPPLQEGRRRGGPAPPWGGLASPRRRRSSRRRRPWRRRARLTDQVAEQAGAWPATSRTLRRAVAGAPVEPPLQRRRRRRSRVPVTGLSGSVQGAASESQPRSPGVRESGQRAVRPPTPRARSATDRGWAV